MGERGRGEAGVRDGGGGMEWGKGRRFLEGREEVLYC